MSLRRSFGRVSNKELFNHGLYSSVIEAKNHWRKIKTVRGGRRGAEYDCYIYSGRECFGVLFQLFIDSVTLDCVARHER